MREKEKSVIFYLSSPKHLKHITMKRVFNVQKSPEAITGPYLDFYDCSRVTTTVSIFGRVILRSVRLKDDV